MENKLALSVFVALIFMFMPGFSAALEQAFTVTAPAWLVAGSLTFFISTFGTKIYSAFKK